MESIRPPTRIAILVWSALGAAGLARAAEQPSLCVQTEPGCLTPGGHGVRIAVGQSDRAIIAGQFTLRYDPAVLTLVDTLPGRQCDASSPFELELGQNVDKTGGMLGYAAGVNLLTGGGGTYGPATLACVRFVPVAGEPVDTDICLLQAAGSLPTLLTDDAGQTVQIDNTVDCPTTDTPPAISCTEVVFDEQCRCEPNPDDCHGLDTACRLGTCNDATRLCEVTPIHEGEPCDDGDACTPLSTCHLGRCIGLGCTNPTICLSPTACFSWEPTTALRVVLTHGERVVVGSQFSLHFDPAWLTLLDIAPGAACDQGSPFTTEVTERVDPVGGDVFYAVGVTPGGTPGTPGPATLACVTFADLGGGHEACLFNGLNPSSTLLVDEFGQAVALADFSTCPTVDELTQMPCAVPAPCNVPAVADWGLLILSLSLLCGATLAIRLRVSHSMSGR